MYIPATKKKKIQRKPGKHLKINIAPFSYSHYDVLHAILSSLLGTL